MPACMVPKAWTKGDLASPDVMILLDLLLSGGVHTCSRQGRTTCRQIAETKLGPDPRYYRYL